MSSNYIHNRQLPIIDDLYQTKNKLLTQLVGNLKIEDVKDDSRFEASIRRIKNQLLFNSVEFEEPKISNHYPSTREVPSNFQNLMGGTQDIFVVTVDFPFSGSNDLFKVTPNNVMYSSGNIYQPHSSMISIEVTLLKLDKKQALSEAKSLMDATKSLIKANNKQATEWSNSMGFKIDSLLKQKRKEILDFYS